MGLSSTIAYYVYVNTTSHLDDSPMNELRRVTAEREALERSFEHFQFNVGKRTWTREDLHARAIRRFAER